MHVARNGKDGLEHAKQAWRTLRDGGAPTLIILDLMLPDINGLEVCQTLRAEQVQLPIIILTALSTVEDRVSGLRLGRTTTFVSLSTLKSCWHELKP